MSDEKTREALEALEARVNARFSHLADSIGTLSRLQGEHTVACAEIKKAEAKQWEFFKEMFEGFAEGFRVHCEADAAFQKEERDDKDSTRKWIWGSLVTGIAVSWGVIGWLATLAFHHP